MNDAAFKEYVRELQVGGLSDHEIALILSGMKLAFVSATGLSAIQNMKCANIAFKFQKQHDPNALTWEK